MVEMVPIPKCPEETWQIVKKNPILFSGTVASFYSVDVKVQHGTREAGLGQREHEARVVAQARPLGKRQDGRKKRRRKN